MCGCDVLSSHKYVCIKTMFPGTAHIDHHHCKCASVGQTANVSCCFKLISKTSKLARKGVKAKKEEYNSI